MCCDVSCKLTCKKNHSCFRPVSKGGWGLHSGLFWGPRSLADEACSTLRVKHFSYSCEIMSYFQKHTTHTIWKYRTPHRMLIVSLSLSLDTLSLLICFSFSFSFACLLLTGSGSYVHVCPCSYFEAMLPAHRHVGTHTVRSPCSHAHFDRVSTACVSWPRDWAASGGTHIQQDMDTASALPCLCAPLSLLETFCVTRSRNWRKSLYEAWLSSMCVCVLHCVSHAPPGATFDYSANTKKQETSAFWEFCSGAIINLLGFLFRVKLLTTL